MKIFFMMVYSQPFRLVPSVYLSLLASARSMVSCSRSLASSMSRVRLSAKGFNEEEYLVTSILKSAVDIDCGEFFGSGVNQIYTIPAKIVSFYLINCWPGG